jgi:hypothetical protein
MMQCFLVFGILFTQTSWALAAEAPVPPANSNANAPKETAAPGAVEKSITDYLCTPDGEGKGTNALIFNCVNKLYRFSIAFGVSVAILFIIFAGYLYMSGSEKGVSEAKSIIENTAAGLLILFVSFLLLRQINPELTRFKSIQLPQIAPPGNTVDPNYVPDAPAGEPDSNSDAGNNSSADHTSTSCGAKPIDPKKRINTANCVNAGTDLHIQCDNNSKCNVQKFFGDILVRTAQAYLPNTFKVSDGYTSGHADGCHGTGACADVGALQGKWVELVNAIHSAGGKAQCEDPRANTLATSVMRGASCDKYLKNGSGPHIHMYVTN